MPPRLPQNPRELLSLASRRWYWMPAAVLALGLVSLILLVGTEWIAERLLVRDIALLGAVSEIQTEVAISHLWLEEYVSGDQVPVDEINDRIVDSQRLVQGILFDGLPGGQVRIQPLEDPELRLRAKSLRAHIDRFDAISRTRQHGWRQGRAAEVAIGSELDQQYDAVFHDLLADVAFLEDALEHRLEANQGRSRLLLRLMLFAWVVIVALAVTGMWTRERRRMAAEVALSKSEAQLLQAQKMEAVGRLAGGVAHDVNNYVAAITAQCELVQRKATPGDRVWQKMEQVIETAYKIAGLTRRLLAFSRQLPIQPQVVSVNEIALGLDKMIRRLIGEDVQLEHRLSPDLWNVKMDPTQVEQVLVNLLVNARDAMPTGGGVSVTTDNARLTAADLAPLPDLAPGDYVVLTVRDAGHGIPPEVMDKVFEPFFTTKARSGSSGIGLSTVYGIVRQAGGAIQVESREGSGTTFRIYLPRTHEPLARAATEPGRVPEAAAGHERLLLVEDNDELRDSVRSALEHLGYQVFVASNGPQAIERFEQLGGRIDLVISDVVMPGMSGREMLDRLRRIQPGLQAVFVSGYTDNVILRHGIQEGEVDFLEKPFSSERLARKIREILGRRPARTGTTG
jgi:signal transduction histidine kinase/ActR/RegA family two-component response regulator